jgi:Holliday junction resolvasome RuvABC ATP-dependent DNA helicase subunit
MYQAMDSLKCELIVDKGPNARHYTLNIEPFTLVGATHPRRHDHRALARPLSAW